MWYKSKTMFLC